MVHIGRFILLCPNLISIEGLGTLPEHCLRSLGKLLGQLPIFRRDCSSLPGNWNVSRQGMPSHSIFDGSLYIGVPCLPHVCLGLLMLVTLTHHSSITVISLWLYACCYVEVELCFRFQILSEFSATQDYLRQFGPLVVAGDRPHRRPPTTNVSGCGRYTLHSPHPSLSSRPVCLFSDWLFSFICKSHFTLGN